MFDDPISRVRRFNRSVTTATGALNTSFLDRGRPLGAARVLNAVGNGRSDVTSIRDYLNLDPALMSRLLRGLEEEGLIETTAHPVDARRRIARLTETGRHEFLAYEAISNTQAQSLLDGYARSEELLSAMDLIASVLGRHSIAIAEADPRGEEASYCFREYYAELAARFEGGFDVSLSRNPRFEDMMRPRGAFFLAMSDGRPVGCVGLKRAGDDIAEIKRLWVSPAARGLGIARRLMVAAEDAAGELSIKTLRLDTNRALPEASQLYRRTGWQEIDRFNDDPYPDTFFEKQL